MDDGTPKPLMGAGVWGSLWTARAPSVSVLPPPPKFLAWITGAGLAQVVSPSVRVAVSHWAVPYGVTCPTRVLTPIAGQSSVSPVSNGVSGVHAASAVAARASGLRPGVAHALDCFSLVVVPT